VRLGITTNTTRRFSSGIHTWRRVRTAPVLLESVPPRWQHGQQSVLASARQEHRVGTGWKVLPVVQAPDLAQCLALISV
jgi:hypothetical protein